MTNDAHMRIAVVTGAGSGIGRAAALALLEDGYHVALIGRRETTLTETAAAATPAAAQRALTVPADVTVKDEVARAFEHIVKTWGRIDVLFNNAGITGDAANFGDIAPEDWDAVVSINLTGAMLCAREAFRIMRDQAPSGGRIINNGSLAAHTPRPHSTAYTATKHAITGLTKSIELDGREFGISAGQIDIGNTATQLVDAFTEGPGALQADGRRMHEPSFPVAEVGEAVLFMANRGPSTTVSSLTIMARGMPFVGRG